MTEAEWLACTDPKGMLEFLGAAASERKLRLFGCGACRRVWELMLDARCRAAVEATEQFADGLISERSMDLISAEAELAWEDVLSDPGEESRIAESVAHSASYSSSPSLTIDVLLSAIQAAAEVGPGGLSIGEIAQTDTIRDIFGNPFRSVAVDPAWLTSAVAALAGGIYAERAFDRMPILADALQDAGCDNDDILNHCRGDGPHVRGCWVVDLLLGKE